MIVGGYEYEYKYHCEYKYEYKYKYKYEYKYKCLARALIALVLNYGWIDQLIGAARANQ